MSVVLIFLLQSSTKRLLQLELFIKRITKAGYHWAHKKLGVSLRLISPKNTADNSQLNYPPNFQGQLFKSVTIRQLFLRHGF